MMLQNSLPSVMQFFQRFQDELYSEIKATHLIRLLPKPLREIPNYPQPTKIPCIASQIAGSSEMKVILPVSSVKIFYEEKKSLVRLLLTEFQIIQSREDALNVFQSYMNSKTKKSPYDIDALQPYLSIKQEKIYHDMWKRPSSIFKAALNFSQQTEQTYLNAYRGSIKDKIFIIKELIIPSLSCAKKIYKYVIEQEPCQFKVLKYNINEISDVTDYRVDNKSSSIFYLVKKIIKVISNNENNSLDILDSVISNINQINGELQNLQIVKEIAVMMKEINKNPKMEIDFIEFLFNQKNPKERENIFIKIAYMISVAALKISINGIGLYSNSDLTFLGIHFFPNAQNSAQNIFTIKKQKIIPFSLQICNEIQNIIKDPFVHNDTSDLEKNDKKRSLYYKSLSDKYHRLLINLQNEHDKLIKDLFNFIDENVDQLKDVISDIGTTNKLNILDFVSKNVISRPVEIAKDVFQFSEKYDRMSNITKEIAFYEDKKLLIKWIEQIHNFEINKKIFGVRIEKDYFRISGIYVDIFTV